MKSSYEFSACKSSFIFHSRFKTSRDLIHEKYSHDLSHHLSFIYDLKHHMFNHSRPNVMHSIIHDLKRQEDYT